MAEQTGAASPRKARSLQRQIHWIWVTIGALALGESVYLFYNTVSDKDAKVQDLSQVIAAVVAAVALLVAIWAVLVTRNISEEIEKLSDKQRLLSANTEINRLWQEFNKASLEGGLNDADFRPSPDADTHDEVRLNFVFYILGVLRQIWIYRTVDDLGSDFWDASACYWSRRLITAYRPEWAYIIKEHRGYDPKFLHQVVEWRNREPTSLSKLPTLEPKLPAPEPESKIAGS